MQSLPDKIQFLGLHGCQTETGCPKSNASPNGCPIWRNPEPWENEQTKELGMVTGCGYAVDPIRAKWNSARAFLAADTAQKMRTENAEIVGKLRALMDTFIVSLKQIAPLFNNKQAIEDKRDGGNLN